MWFGVLGGLEVRAADDTAVRVPEARVRTLLAALLIRDGHPVSAERLIDDVWGQRLPADPRRALRAKVSLLRGVLGRTPGGGRERIAHGPGGYRLV